MKTDGTIPELLSFLDNSPTAAHATELVSRRLEENDYRRLDECSIWKLGPGEKFHVVRSSSAIVAGITGSDSPGDTGIRIIGAHTDFPGFRVKPMADRLVDGMNTLAVEVYGGPILSTWFDRDLAIAGSLVMQEGSSLARKPFRISDPICRIASPAVHLEREMNKKGFKVDAEKHTPLLLSSSGAGLEDLLDLACRSADIRKEDTCGWSMEVYDPQPAVLGGIAGDFIFSGRLDNLLMCHAAMEALLDIQSPEHTVLIALFNSEEVGSATLNGAGSCFLDSIIERLAGGREEFMRCLCRSIQISADGAHGVHPNYFEKHDSGCRPVLGGGPVIKINAKERYSTSDLTSAYFKKCAERVDVEVQCFVSRNDMICGTTIGPMVSSRTGIRSVDAGNAMLSMHSVREMSGTVDHESMIKVLGEHLRGTVDISI